MRQKKIILLGAMNRGIFMEKINYGDMKEIHIKKEDIVLTEEWDKVFPKSDEVNHKKVTFVNHFGITLAADQYEPKNYEGKLDAIAVCGPYSAVKEQVSGRYAQEMARRGFLTIAFDPSFYGESGGTPRYMNSLDFAVEDYEAAIDYLSTLDNVDPNKIGIIGICGWGGFALQTASIDTRIKATLTSTMYDMTRVSSYGYNDVNDEDTRYQARVEYSNKRTEDYKNKTYTLLGGNPEVAPQDAPQFLKDYVAFYRHRGYHKRSLGSNDGFAYSVMSSLLNTHILEYTNEIRSAVLMIHGEKAHSCYFSKDAYQNMIENSKYTDNKELMVIPNAVHCDLYDNLDVIPFDKIETFFKTYLG